MPSTYSNSLRLELQADNENQGNWGSITNRNLGTLLESAISGVRGITLPDTDYTLSALNGADDEARYAYLSFTGTLTTTRNVIVPTPPKIYRISNGTNQPLIIKTVTGTGVTIPAGRFTTVYSNGVNVLAAANFIPTLFANTLSGDGAGLTNLNADNLASGIVPSARLSGSYNISVTGSATALATPRTISLTGDVAGSVSFDGTQNVSITATIQPDSVALGTDTTGNYVATGAVSGNGLTGSATGEGATFTVTSNATAANTASTIVFRDASGNFSAGTITANLTGTATTATNVSGGTASVTTLTTTGNATLGDAVADSHVINGRLENNGPVQSTIVTPAALDIDTSQGNYFTKTINDNSTFTFSNPPATKAYAFTLELVHTSGTVTWPTSVVWPNNTPPTLTTGKTHVFVFLTDNTGTTWRGSSLINYNN